MIDKNILEEVYSQWQNNPEFRQEFKKNPQNALAHAGIELNADDLHKIEAMLNQKKLNEDDELEKRINK